MSPECIKPILETIREELPAAVKAAKTLASDADKAIRGIGASAPIEGDSVNIAMPAIVSKKIDIVPAYRNDQVRSAMGWQNEHIDKSPWLRTISHLSPLPEFQGHMEVDHLVVGGGVVGQQIAYGLAGIGKKVASVTDGRLGSGTSQHMGAMNTVIPDSGLGVMLDKLGPERFESMMQRLLAGRSRVETLGRQYGDFRPVNTYTIAYSEHNPDVAAEVQLLSKFDPRVRLVAGDEAAKIHPLAKSVAIVPNEGNLNPLKLINGMARSGKYQAFEHSPVLAVAPTTDGALAFTPKGTIHAKEGITLATNSPVTPFAEANEHMTPVQTFVNQAHIGREMPGNYFDSPDLTSGKVPFTYWRPFGLPGFTTDETLVGGTAHFLHIGNAVRFEDNLGGSTRRLFPSAKIGDQATAMIWTDYEWGLPVYYTHPEHRALSAALGGGGTGLSNGALLTESAIRHALGKEDAVLSSARFLRKLD